MNKKSLTGTEMQIKFLEESFVYEVIKQDIRVRKMLLKGGFGDWLLVITARKDDEAVVCFLGAASIQGIAAKLHKGYLEDTLVWKPDRYAE